MTSYRFCRSDDIPLLVEAYNHCYRPHFSELAELTPDGFKALIRSHDLWTSSCMVAQAGSEPIAVLFSAKRDHASLIYLIGVHPDHQRQGHGQHLLTSLSQKLAILGPPTLLADVPITMESGRALLEACNYRYEETGRDWLRRSGTLTHESPAERLIVSVTASELQEQGARSTSNRRAWLSQEPALVDEDTRGLAVLSDVRVEAWLLYRPRELSKWGASGSSAGAGAELLAMKAINQPHEVPLLTLLLDRLEREIPGGVHLTGTLDTELPADGLETLGFKEVSRTLFYTVEARPA